VEEPASSLTNDETTNKLCAGSVRAQATFESSVPINQKKKRKYTYALLKTSSLKEGAM
jgi:hypothetical protein